MGFLLGAYGKLAAGSRMRSIQARMLRVSAKLRRITRQVQNMEKMISRQEKTLTNNITIESNLAKQMAMNQIQSPELLKVLEKVGGYTTNGTLTELTQDEKKLYSDYQLNMNNLQFMTEISTAQMKQQVTEMIEQMREQLLEPLKDEEDELQLEQDSLKSQLEIASNDYKACQEMEKNDAKMLAPSYTAGGQG
ncbi:hypothetical protein J6I39_08560 [bacterium]|nr:hypothetical protein [bacterium]